MAAFDEFLTSLSSDPNTRGKEFERFVKWFLNNDPEWQTQVDTIWMWDDYPDRWGPDCGIDLVFGHKNGETWAVQAKCYAPDYPISKKDIDSFISDSARSEIDHRLLIATTDRIGPNARRVMDGVSPNVVRFLLSDFESASIDYPSSIESLTKGHRKPRPSPYDYQETAINDVLTGFGCDTDAAARMLLARWWAVGNVAYASGFSWFETCDDG